MKLGVRAQRLYTKGWREEGSGGSSTVTLKIRDSVCVSFGFEALAKILKEQINKQRSLLVESRQR